MERGKYIPIVIVLCFLSYVFIPRIHQSMEKISRLNDEIERIDERLISEEKRLEELKENIERLDDPFYKEKLVRDRLRMVREGEVIYKLFEE